MAFSPCQANAAFTNAGFESNSFACWTINSSIFGSTVSAYPPTSILSLGLTAASSNGFTNIVSAGTDVFSGNKLSYPLYGTNAAVVNFGGRTTATGGIHVEFTDRRGNGQCGDCFSWNSGAIAIYATDDSDLVIDVNGYFGPVSTNGLSLYIMTPCRAFDTRANNGARFEGTIDFNLTGSSCNPPAAAQAFVLNATVVPASELWYFSLWSNWATQPAVSMLYASGGAVTSNMAIVPTGNGSISAFATNPTQLILDILGYFAP
jgi:hypothetical protein